MIREDVCEIGFEGLKVGVRFRHADRTFVRRYVHYTVIPRLTSDPANEFFG